MKAQDIFDTVTRHLFTQGKAAYNSTDGCVYRGPDGTSCAVGCIMPDSVYRKGMEGSSINDLLQSNFKIPQWMVKNEGLLGDLQSVHDNRASTDMDDGPVRPFLKHDLLDGLYNVALDHNLDIAVLKEFGFDETTRDF